MTIKQTDFKNGSLIMLYGCRFMSLLFIAEKYAELCKLKFTPFTMESIEKFALNCVDKKIISINSTEGYYKVIDDNDLINSAFTFIGVPQLYGFQSGLTNRPSLADPVYWNEKFKTFNFCILEWKTLSGSHFTVGDIEGKEIYDPWDKNVSGSIKMNFKRYLLYLLRKK